MLKIELSCLPRNKPEQSSNVLRESTKINNRKNDTRKKILVGAYTLDKHKKENTIEILRAELDTFLTRKQDRELFGLS